jgi:ubiquinone/menaquinone biosynthesis C-methylase UbiE
MPAVLAQPCQFLQEVSLMPVMSAVEAAFCRSGPWRYVARRLVLPWALNGRQLAGDVLEIGGGSGAMARGVARTFQDAKLTVTDVDEAMVRSARNRLRKHPSVTVETADATALPFASGSFDVVTSYLTLHHVIRWQEALAEAARVLRPGGLLLGYDLTETRLAHIIHRLDGSPHDLLSPDELRHGLSMIGFRDVQVDAHFSSHVMRFHAKTPSQP